MKYEIYKFIEVAFSHLPPDRWAELGFNYLVMLNVALA